MMKNKYQKTSHHRSKYLAVSLFIIIITVFGALIAFKYLQPTNTPAVQPASSTKTVIKKATKKTKKSTKPVSTNDPEEDPFGKKPVQNEGTDPNQSSTYTGVVNYAGVVDQKLMIRVTINQFIQETGTCTLTLRSQDKTYQVSAPTINNSSYATCRGFDIPISELSTGHWDINIKVTTSNKSGLINGKVDI